MTQRDLAAKYHISKTIIERRCKDEKWSDERKAARDAIATKVIQKTADQVADTVTVATRIKRKLLLKLEKEIDALPEKIGSETRNSTLIKGDVQTETSISYKLRDLTAAYKELTADMDTGQTENNELLQSLLSLERGEQQ